MQPQYPQLLRRPLPPQISSESSYKRKIHRAKTDKTKPLHVRLTDTEDGTSSIKRDETSTDIVSRTQPQALVHIQNIFLDYPEPEKVTPISLVYKSTKNASSCIPDTVTAPMFFPSHLSARTQIFRKETQQMKSSRKSPTAPRKIENVFFDETLQNILILSSTCSKSVNVPCQIIETNFKTVSPEHQLLPKTQDYRDISPLRTMTLPTPLPSTSSIKGESQGPAHFPQGVEVLGKVILNINQFPATISFPKPTLPRKPRRQSIIETLATENEKTENIPKPPEGVTRRRKIDYSDADVLHGEGFRTVAATGYETVTAMTELAVVNCQMYGRNALNLKGFFIMNCPDLTPLASQLVYLNLSFNDFCNFPAEIFCLKNLQVLKLRNNPIRAIPSDIQQLKFLRIFSIAFNFISDLPFGLFSLSHLEDLDISYNEITSIPNDIQRLRSLEKLNIDGNYLFHLPPGILKLNLTKVSFENTFTDHRFWTENSLNSPPRLTQITSLFIVKNNLHTSYDIPVKIQKLLKRSGTMQFLPLS
ncbi:PREDICTED: leucine-rich repeat-containing protein 63 isoform X2 [Chinchilla lanigera]|uniref:leucine-rich repeat-containing protein 63 isoform X2 n=1 Tax=Chinchilla lanigera TaxID=34839 RepID=UPI00038EFEE3|nr:PREDICTED: leucine-rich repeat-containing protein 63 isoform X2 [Chinchilla lanigera]